VLEESPDSSSDVALEAASDLAVGLALGSPLLAVDTGRFVAGRASECDDVEGAVEPAVAVAVERCRSWLWPDVVGIGATPARRANAAS
jgi:hypothetical protein